MRTAKRAKGSANKVTSITKVKSKAAKAEAVEQTKALRSAEASIATDQQEEPGSGGRLRIAVFEGYHEEAAGRAERALLKHAKQLGVFQYAGELVKVVTLPKLTEGGGLKRQAGTVMLRPLGPDAMARTFEQVALFGRMRRAKKGLVFSAINCPERVVNYYLSGCGEWSLPLLRGIISAPIMRPDGTILSEPGYDEKMGLFLASDCQWLGVPKRPTLADAQKALKTLCAPFGQFPFVHPAHRAVHIAAILTALQRRLLPACPGFAYTAPVQRSGKSKLAEAVGLIATGVAPPATTFSTDKEEFRKAITSALRENQLIVHFDNIDHAVKSKELAMVITQSEFSDRLLGENRKLYLPTNVLWLINGNNVEFRGDLRVRVLLCRIDANTERPEERTFAIPNLEAHILGRRPQLVQAALTILRAFHVAGSPQAIPEWGGFEDWSRRIREPLVWLRMEDPCETRKEVLDEDTERESASQALAQLGADFPAGFTMREAIGKANDKGALGMHKFPDLFDALMAVAAVDGNINALRLSTWMRSRRGHIIDGRKLQRVNAEGAGLAKWRVEGVKT